jgi:hypothetical protein
VTLTVAMESPAVALDDKLDFLARLESAVQVTKLTSWRSLLEHRCYDLVRHTNR